MKRRRTHPDGATHQPLTIRRDAPLTLTLDGFAAAELRRLAFKHGTGSDSGAAKLATACVLRGLVYVEADLEATAPKSAHQVVYVEPPEGVEVL